MKRFKINFINEEALTQAIVKPADVSYNETQENSEEQNQENELTANINELQPQDVDNMSDGAVLGTMLSPNQEIEDNTWEKLGKKANDFINKMTANTITPQDKKDISNEVITSIKTSQNRGFGESILWNELESKILTSLVESLDYNVKSWIKAISGTEPKGREGSANWIGNDLYYELEKDENGRIHYFNKWIGMVDKNNKVVYINDTVAPNNYINDIIQAANVIDYKVKTTSKIKNTIDMGYEDENDPMYSEAYSSGRSDTFDEPSHANDSFDEPDYDEEDFTMSLSVAVANSLCNDFILDEDTEGRVLAWVCDWLNQHKELVRRRWQKKSSFSGDDPSEADIFIVKNNMEEDFKRNFKIK